MRYIMIIVVLFNLINIISLTCSPLLISQGVVDLKKPSDLPNRVISVMGSKWQMRFKLDWVLLNTINIFILLFQLLLPLSHVKNNYSKIQTSISDLYSAILDKGQGQETTRVCIVQGIQEACAHFQRYMKTMVPVSTIIF